MKLSRFPQLRVPALVAVCAFVALPPLSADTYTGRVRLNGTIQNAAKPGSLSFVYQGTVASKSGDRATVSGGGLLRTADATINNTTFRGKMTSYVRYSASINRPSKLVKRVANTSVSVRGRIVRIPGATIRLTRPVNGNSNAPQRISGSGNLTVRR